MAKTIDVAEFTAKLRKIIQVSELPEGFYYFTDTHIVEGTGEFKPTKKRRTAATVVLSDQTIR